MIYLRKRIIDRYDQLTNLRCMHQLLISQGYYVETVDSHRSEFLYYHKKDENLAVMCKPCGIAAVATYYTDKENTRTNLLKGVIKMEWIQ